MQHPDNIAAVCLLEIAYMGFIFYPQSPRFAGNLRGETLRLLPAQLQRVGVFVNASEAYIKEQVTTYGLNLVQLHGTESPAMCEALQQRGIPVMKAFNIATKEDFAQTEAYQSVCRYFVFDTKTVLLDASGETLHGGTGKQFDWQLLTHYTGEVPFFLSGGIGLSDAEHLGRLHHPRLQGVDVNSRFETSPGTKDATQLKTFIHRLTDAITTTK